MKLVQGNVWIQLSRAAVVTGDRNHCKVTGEASCGQWEANITNDGVSISPEEVDDAFSGPILQFIGEVVAPLILSGQYMRGRDTQVFLPKPFILQINGIPGQRDHNNVLLGLESGEVYSPINGVVKSILKVPAFNGEKVCLAIKTTDLVHTIEYAYLNSINKKLEIGTPVYVGTYLGDAEGTLELVEHSSNGESISPLSFYGSTGLDLIYEAFERVHYEVPGLADQIKGEIEKVSSYCVAGRNPEEPEIVLEKGAEVNGNGNESEGTEDNVEDIEITEDNEPLSNERDISEIIESEMAIKEAPKEEDAVDPFVGK